MRHSLVLLVLLTFFIFGCTENSSLVNPVNDSNNLEWINLQSNSLSKTSLSEEDLLFAKMIDPEKGGTIKIKVKGDISIKGKLKVPKKSFDGKPQNFKVQLSPDLFTIDFDPSGYNFDPSVIFTILYEGIKLKKSDIDIKFAYMCEDGTIEIVEDAKIVIDLKKGILGVKNVKISHFSRWGFVK